MAVGLVDLFDPGRYYPVYRSLLSQLDSLSIIRLSKTCRRLATLYRSAIPREWSVDRLLGRFVCQPLALREVMRDHRAVISGELALQFFSRARQTDHMDMFVEKPSEAKALKEHLVRNEGYRVKKDPSSCDKLVRGTGSSPTYRETIVVTLADSEVCEERPRCAGCLFESVFRRTGSDKTGRVLRYCHYECDQLEQSLLLVPTHYVRRTRNAHSRVDGQSKGADGDSEV
jgi:hypothetical protein